MAKIRITKEFRFDMAHALHAYPGKCRYLHGHTFRLLVTVIGEPSQKPGAPEEGMVMDFGALKQIVNEEVIDRYDHTVLVHQQSKLDNDTLKDEMFGRLVRFPVQPSTENLLLDFKARIQPGLPEGVNLHSLRLYETPNSYAAWYASDNDGE